jgi:hypothetical protein
VDSLLRRRPYLGGRLDDASLPADSLSLSLALSLVSAAAAVLDVAACVSTFISLMPGLASQSSTRAGPEHDFGTCGTSMGVLPVALQLPQFAAGHPSCVKTLCWYTATLVHVKHYYENTHSSTLFESKSRFAFREAAITPTRAGTSRCCCSRRRRGRGRESSRRVRSSALAAAFAGRSAPADDPLLSSIGVAVDRLGAGPG